MTSFLARLRALPADQLAGIRRGVEKESLRTRADGMLATTSHPRSLGSALTHPHITTDFSESQLELITGVHDSIDACLEQLAEVHQIVYREIGDEILWATSMPCMLPADDEIPLGRYGRSNVGTAKTVYRMGLASRYGRRMQTISGIHYNFSMPEAAWPLLQRADARSGAAGAYRDDAYFGLIRNFRRHTWLLLYLFGASPAVCGTFLEGRTHSLLPIGRGTYSLPDATSLRMGPLGYQSDAQRSLTVSYNNLQSYARSIRGALTEPYPPYEAIGLRDGDRYNQLSTTLLQIENEFYGTIRPKRRIMPGERPLHALGERGVEYVEVRCMDVDPFIPTGIDADTMRMLDVFLLHCLLTDSVLDSPEELGRVAQNQHRVAEYGRQPGLVLVCRDGDIKLADWADELFVEFEPIAEALDAAMKTGVYRDVVARARAAVADPSKTPSAHVLKAVTNEHDSSFKSFALAQSLAHREDFLRQPLADATLARYRALAAESLVDQKRIEDGENESFEDFRKRYLSTESLGVAGF